MKRAIEQLERIIARLEVWQAMYGGKADPHGSAAAAKRELLELLRKLEAQRK